MSERFNAWPYDAEGTIREALREYVGDGDGEDERVLDATLRAAKAEGWLACADEARDCGYLGAIDHEQLINRDPYGAEEGR